MYYKKVSYTTKKAKFIAFKDPYVIGYLIRVSISIENWPPGFIKQNVIVGYSYKGSSDWVKLVWPEKYLSRTSRIKYADRTQRPRNKINSMILKLLVVCWAVSNIFSKLTVVWQFEWWALHLLVNYVNIYARRLM